MKKALLLSGPLVKGQGNVFVVVDVVLLLQRASLMLG